MATSTLNRNLRFIRERMGLNQTGFAVLMGTSRGMVSHFERGRIEPSNGEIMNLCRTLRITMDELTGIDFERSNYRYLDIRRTYQMQRRGNG